MPSYEIFCALSTSALISPIMTLIDASIIRAQIHKQRFPDAVAATYQHFIQHRGFARPAAIMMGVYSSTYSAANLADVYCRKHHIQDKKYSLAATSTVNVAAIIYKDREYAKLFNNGKFPVFPKTSMALFAARDAFTMYSCFILKKDAIAALERHTHMPHNAADFVASLCLPIAAQILSTPLHILAIDIYQSPPKGARERWKNVRDNYKTICLGRMMRVIPAFCVGGFVNDMLREKISPKHTIYYP